MIVIKNYRTRVLDNQLIGILRLIVTCEDSRTELVNEASFCIPLLAVAYTTSLIAFKSWVGPVEHLSFLLCIGRAS